MNSASQFQDIFHGQFRLTRVERGMPPGFLRSQCGGWILDSHPALPVHRLVNDAGAQVGFVLGYPIQNGHLFLEPGDLRFHNPNGSATEAVTDFLNKTSGRYLVVILDGHPQSPVVYPDAFASLAVVYSPEKQIVASTTSLLEYHDGTATRYPINVYPDVGFFYYPAGLTDMRHCFRLLPNHQLDLSTWQVCRFWPLAPFYPCEEDRKDEYILKAIEAVRENLVATAVRPTTYGGLTAGRDSRVLLACTPQSIRDRTEYITFNYPNRKDSNLKDVHVSKILAKRHHLRHRIVNVRTPSEDVRSTYFYRIGRAGGTGKSSDFFQAAYESLDMDSAWLTGFGGEVSCMYYVTDEDQVSRPTAANLLDRICQSQEHGCLEAVQRWLDGLSPDFPNELLVELFYIENRVGSWACPHLYGAAPFLVNLIPYCDSRYVQACLTLPYAFRRSRASQMRMIELADPSLLETPFETLTGWALWKRRLLRNRYFDFSKWF
ncbi:MAG: hypothetical protein U0929_19860 [Planctomycetaceae bacterium]